MPCNGAGVIETRSHAHAIIGHGKASATEGASAGTCARTEGNATDAMVCPVAHEQQGQGGGGGQGQRSGPKEGSRAHCRITVAAQAIQLAGAPCQCSHCPSGRGKDAHTAGLCQEELSAIAAGPDVRGSSKQRSRANAAIHIGAQGNAAQVPTRCSAQHPSAKVQRTQGHVFIVHNVQHTRRPRLLHKGQAHWLRVCAQQRPAPQAI